MTDTTIGDYIDNDTLFTPKIKNNKHDEQKALAKIKKVNKHPIKKLSTPKLFLLLVKVLGVLIWRGKFVIAVTLNVLFIAHYLGFIGR